MNTRKLCGTVAAAIFTIALSAPALAALNEAECEALLSLTKTDLIGLQTDLACENYPEGIGGGVYPENNPIWQFRLKKKKNSTDQGDGCEIHYKLSKLLYENAQVKKGKGKGYAALLDGKYQYAYDLLVNYSLSALDATTEPMFNVAEEGEIIKIEHEDADSAVKHFLGRGMTIQGQIDKLKTYCPTS